MALARYAACLLTVGLLLLPPSTAGAQNLREIARHQAAKDPSVPLEIPAPPGHYEVKTMEEMGREARIVLEGRLSHPTSYLGRSEDRVLTDYTVVEARVILGQLSTPQSERPGPGKPIVLTVWGGQIDLEGVTVRGTDSDLNRITVGGRYLLFLRDSRANKPGHYEPYNGGIFEISGGRLKALLKNGNEVFPDAEHESLSDVIARVHKAKGQ